MFISLFTLSLLFFPLISRKAHLFTFPTHASLKNIKHSSRRFNILIQTIFCAFFPIPGEFEASLSQSKIALDHWAEFECVYHTCLCWNGKNKWNTRSMCTVINRDQTGGFSRPLFFFFYEISSQDPILKGIYPLWHLSQVWKSRLHILARKKKVEAPSPYPISTKVAVTVEWKPYQELYTIVNLVSVPTVIDMVSIYCQNRTKIQIKLSFACITCNVILQIKGKDWFFQTKVLFFFLNDNNLKNII